MRAWRNGSRAGLKIQWSEDRASSNLAARTVLVAQLVEQWLVAPKVVGSSPI